jgi:hypothetical protein
MNGCYPFFICFARNGLIRLAPITNFTILCMAFPFALRAYITAGRHDAKKQY